MRDRLQRTIAISTAVAAVAVAALLLTAGPAMAAKAGQPIVELAYRDTPRGLTIPSTFKTQKISGTDNLTKQEYKFQRQREGRDFSYTVANLQPGTFYNVELSFVEHNHSAAGQRLFNVYLQDRRVTSLLDIYRMAGKDGAYQEGFATRANAGGRVELRLRSNEPGCMGTATVSTVRIYSGPVSSAVNVVEIDAAASRLNMTIPTRFTNGAEQDCYETVLGRMGSRFGLGLLPQKLGARLSSLGDGTGDLADLVIGLDEGPGAGLRCLPFTDRYPVFDRMTLSTTMTSQKYECFTDSHRLTVEFRSPFYPPGDDPAAEADAEKLSGAPFLYVNVTVENLTGEATSPRFVFARPHKESYAGSCAAALTADGIVGCRAKTRYAYWDESVSTSSWEASEALAAPAAEADDLEFKYGEESFGDFKVDEIWGFKSPERFPRAYGDYKRPLYSFYPRGYTGVVWSPTLGPGGGGASLGDRHFVMSGHVPGRVLNVSNDRYSDRTFRFKYARDPGLADVEAVAKYALDNRAEIEEKSDFFDGTVSSDGYLSLPEAYSSEVRQLIACTFQSFLMNTWSAVSDSGREWFSVWEGSSCRFHSTIDVEYNDSWFYFHFWPGKLRMLLEEWLMYPNLCRQGKYLSHDMGVMDQATGQAYPFNMAVEENADYVLLLYKYWKTTGDTDFMRSVFGSVRELVDFIANCDDNGNGLPDLFTSNTIDQGSHAIQHGRDQSYLGVKCLAAHQAAGEMALSLATPDVGYAGKCRARVELINQTLEQDLWLSDHFAVCYDADVPREDREAYSIYPANGLTWLMSGSRASGLTAPNEARMRRDLVNSTARTLKTYGCVHSSCDSRNQWISQNIFRDQAAAMLGVRLDSANPLAMSVRYWKLQRYFATSMWGSFWDSMLYPVGAGGGPLRLSPSFPGAGGGGSLRLTPASPGGAAEDPCAGGGAGGGPRRPAGDQGVREQLLGYYPRGIASLGLIDALAGLTLDAPGNALYYRVPSDTPVTVPVFSRADWGNRRVPTLAFDGVSGAPAVTHEDLLPDSFQLNDRREMTGVRAGGHALSPNGDGVNDLATVRYTLPLPCSVDASIWEGSRLVKSYPRVDASRGDRSFTWDGRDSRGAVVEDGVYTARIDAAPDDPSRTVRPASATVNVNSTVPDLSRDWYLAEGFTGENPMGGRFEEYILVQNPGSDEARLRVTFMMPGGENKIMDYAVPAASRFTIPVHEILPDREVSAHLQSDRPVAVERSMYFNGRRAGHDSIGASRPSKTWYLAEGYTAEGFDEYVLVQNPGDAEAALRVTFMTPGAGNQVREYRVSPRSRFTIHVDDVIPAQSVSTKVESSRPVVVERAQYLNNMTAGTCSIGAVSASRTWYLAEGFTDQGFETWVLVQNPQRSRNKVTMVFMERDGTNTLKQYLLPPESRFTVFVGAYLEASEVSVRVRSEHPVLVERAMYWNDRSDGHACIGTPTPDTDWYLAEGYTDQGFETWVLVQNPSDETRRVTATFMEPGGRDTRREFEVPPRSRFTIGLNGILPAAEVSTRVSADGPVIVERSMYFNDRSGGTCSLGIRGY